MIKKILISVALSQLFFSPAVGQPLRELNSDELRANVDAGATKSLASILKTVNASVEGEVVEVRAFYDGGIYYQVFIMQPGGKLASVVLDAVTGRFLPNDSKVAALVRKAAKLPKSNNGKSATAGSKGKSSSKSAKEKSNNKNKSKNQVKSNNKNKTKEKSNSGKKK